MSEIQVFMCWDLNFGINFLTEGLMGQIISHKSLKPLIFSVLLKDGALPTVNQGKRPRINK